MLNPDHNPSKSNHTRTKNSDKGIRLGLPMALKKETVLEEYRTMFLSDKDKILIKKMSTHKQNTMTDHYKCRDKVFKTFKIK